jgi:hypothetical protein
VQTIGLLSDQVSGEIPASHRDLVKCPPVAALTTVMPDGHPQTSLLRRRHPGALRPDRDRPAGCSPRWAAMASPSRAWCGWMSTARAPGQYDAVVFTVPAGTQAGRASA